MVCNNGMGKSEWEQLVNMYKIYNLIGAKVIKGFINFNETIEIQHLKKGLYFLKFENEKPIKFIKK